MTSLKKLLFLAFSPFLFTACDGEKKQTRKERLEAEEQFFEETPVSDLSELENEMAEAPTDFLRLLKNDPIPWQAWNPSVLEKAKATQSPILAFIVSSRDGGCRDTAKRIFADPEILTSLRDRNVCTLIDIHANPELGLLSYVLCGEIRQPVGFPMLIWMSHEACPLAWLPIADLETKNLKLILSNSTAMVDEIWKESSDYAVRNSRRDIEARQERLDSSLKREEEETKRLSIFRRQARQVAALYDPISGNIDGAGGLIPSSALELLCRGHLSPLLSPGVRQRSKEAIQGIIQAIENGAIHDPLDGLYFYARRSQDWSLPAFSKDLETQAQYATALIHSGQSINDPEITNTGLEIIKRLKTNWLIHNYTNESSLLEKKIPGVFLWDWETLNKTLNPEEIEIAKTAFKLKKAGNIPVISDPIFQFRELNSLSFNPSESTPALEQVIKKLREHREKTGAIFRETQVTAQARARFCLAQLAAWSATGSSFDLAEAVASGNLIRNKHSTEGKQLSRFPSSFEIKARGGDYARSILAGISLYQATLDPEWLTWSSRLANEALDQLTDNDDDFLIAETAKDDQIVPITLHNSSMVFAESTIGLFDQSVTRLAALTGDERFRKSSTAIAKSLSQRSERLPIIHTDFVVSCALSETPLVAVLSGELKDPKYQDFIKRLNHIEFTSFLTLRSDKEEGNLKPLPDFPDFGGSSGITLIRGTKVLGQAQSMTQFRDLMQKAISQKE